MFSTIDDKVKALVVWMMEGVVVLWDLVISNELNLVFFAVAVAKQNW